MTGWTYLENDVFGYYDIVVAVYIFCVVRKAAHK